MSTAIRIAHPIHVRRLPGAPRKPRTHPEDDFRREVERKLREYGWRFCHFPDSRRLEGDPGIPDDLAVRPPRILLIEFKDVHGQASPDQVKWLAAIWACNRVECYVWRPADWPTILRTIR